MACRLVNRDMRVQGRPEMLQGLQLPAFWPAILFGVAMLAGVVCVVVISGHFPMNVTMIGTHSKRGRKLAIVLLGIATLSLFVMTGIYAFGVLTWYAAIMIGGLAVLAGPLCEQVLPMRFRADTVGLCVLSCFDLALAGGILTRI